MLASIQHLLRYRALIQSLVARELTARYRGSVLGLFWSFVNPLLLLLIYTFVFTRILKVDRGAASDHVAVFMFCGILPWTWFSSSLLESSSTLITNGNLIRKVVFPAEVLPLVVVTAGLVHFCLGLVILLGFIAFDGVDVAAIDLLWLPVLMAVQWLLTVGFALLLSALTVHFRDIRDLLGNLLTLWFFGTPILYGLDIVGPGVRRILELNPFTHLVVAYQEVLVVPGQFVPGLGLALVAGGAVLLCAAGLVVFDRLRDTLAEDV